jgi:hypothetical protein
VVFVGGGGWWRKWTNLEFPKLITPMSVLSKLYLKIEK